jgi:hypothetical protein
MTSSIKQYFPDYEGDDQDFNAARTYFKQRFIRLNRSQTKEIYPSFTNATDPTLLKIVMASVTDIIITNSLRDSECQFFSTLYYPFSTRLCFCGVELSSDTFIPLSLPPLPLPLLA